MRLSTVKADRRTLFSYCQSPKICLLPDLPMSRTGLFFEEFPPTSTDSWIDAIETELKGRVSVDDLTWHPEPDLDVRPFYRREDVRTETHPQIRRRTRWLICDRIYLSPGMDLAPEVEVMKESGADAVELILPMTMDGDEIDLSALEGLNKPIFLFGEYASLELHIDSLIGSVSLPSVSLLYDPICRLFTDPSYEFSPVSPHPPVYCRVLPAGSDSSVDGELMPHASPRN